MAQNWNCLQRDVALAQLGLSEFELISSAKHSRMQTIQHSEQYIDSSVSNFRLQL